MRETIPDVMLEAILEAIRAVYLALFVQKMGPPPPAGMTGRRSVVAVWLGGVGDTHHSRPVKGRAVSVDWWPVHRFIACATCPHCVSAAVPQTCLVTTNTSPGPRRCPFGQCVGGWVIHCPVVVCTRSPSTTTSLRPATALVRTAMFRHLLRRPVVGVIGAQRLDLVGCPVSAAASWRACSTGTGRTRCAGVPRGPHRPQIAAAAGVSKPRVYQIRDGRR